MLQIRLTSIIILLTFSLGMVKTSLYAQVKIGVFADCQYVDSETKGVRYYRNSLKKLDDCISAFNKDENIEFVVGLGDLIDEDLTSFKAVNEVLSNSKHNVYHVTGNHDYSVKPEDLEKVLPALNMKKGYYTFQREGWQFIFLNGNEITFNSNNKETIKQAEQKVQELKAQNLPNAHTWNGGVGEKQIQWLKEQLDKAEQKNRKVVLFCHYPLLPFEDHVLWDGKEVLEALKKYNCVKAWINGHNHAGGYVCEEGIHFVTMKGMVDTEFESAYSVITFSEKEIVVKGFDREESRILKIK